MVRSHWMGVAALVLASAGLVRGQGFAPAAPADGRPERFLTVQEVGRPPLRCRVLKSWYEADGSRALQVQAVSTGEMISIFESGASAVAPGVRDSTPVASRIVHWGTAKHPPAGTPEAPEDATAYGLQSPDATSGWPRERTQSQTSHPFMAKTPPGGWPAAYAGQPPTKLLQPQPSPPVQMARIPAPAQPTAARPVGAPAGEDVARKQPSAVTVKAPPAAAVPAPTQPKPLPGVAVKASPPGATTAPAEKAVAAGAGDPAVSKW